MSDSLTHPTFHAGRVVRDAPWPQPNIPPTIVVERLRTVTAPMLEQVRTLLGDRPIIVSSGYRSPAVNAAVGGVVTSAHLTGYAADFICPDFGTPVEICNAISHSPLDFDQLIQEGIWVHLSVDPRMRREVLTKTGAGFSPGLSPPRLAWLVTSGARAGALPTLGRIPLQFRPPPPPSWSASRIPCRRYRGHSVPTAEWVAEPNTCPSAPKWSARTSVGGGAESGGRHGFVYAGAGGV